MDGFQITCWVIVALCSLGCIYLAWEISVAPLLDENERPIEALDPVDVIAWHARSDDPRGER